MRIIDYRATRNVAGVSYHDRFGFREVLFCNDAGYAHV